MAATGTAPTCYQQDDLLFETPTNLKVEKQTKGKILMVFHFAFVSMLSGTSVQADISTSSDH